MPFVLGGLSTVATLTILQLAGKIRGFGIADSAVVFGISGVLAVVVAALFFG